MRPMKKWIPISLGVGALLTVVLIGVFVAASETIPHPPAALVDATNVAFWPVATLVNLSGPGPNIGTQEKPIHEVTPVQVFAIAIGITLTWIFYSSLVFLLVSAPQHLTVD
jgi:hypothetical protein